MATRWSCPFEGLGYFFSHPRLWGWAFLSTLLAGTLALFILVKIILTTYPHPFTFWLALRSFGWGTLAFVLVVLFFFPLIFNVCFFRAFSNQLKREGIKTSGGSAWQSIFSSLNVFLRTLKWRLLWPLILIAVILFVPPLIFPVAVLAANHLVVIEGVDLVLSVFGVDAKGRAKWIQERGRDCLAAALSSSLLSVFLGVIFIGWIFWVPAIYCGIFIWLRPQFLQKSRH